MKRYARQNTQRNYLPQTERVDFNSHQFFRTLVKHNERLSKLGML